jgi:NADPH:quinone reductase-like Zn-dependent oxidoreductase
MRAMVISEFGEPEVLRLTDVPTPEPQAGEALVRVGASFVARTRDVAVRSGRQPFFSRLITLPHILGGEHAGTVAAVGPQVPPELLGSRVAVSAPINCGTCRACQAGRTWDCTASTGIGIQRQGSNAEFTVVPAANLERIPAGMSFVDAALLAASGPLAHEQLKAGHAAPGKWVMVPGASGSVGTLVVALAARQGARVIALTRGRRAAATLATIGAELVLDTEDAHLSDELLRSTDGGVDVVIDNLGLVDLWERYWPALARHAHVVFAGRVGDASRPLPLNVIELYNRRVTLTGLTIGDKREVASFWAEMHAQPLTLPGDLVRTFPLEQAATAHAAIEHGDKLGHYVLTP